MRYRLRDALNCGYINSEQLQNYAQEFAEIELQSDFFIELMATQILILNTYFCIGLNVDVNKCPPYTARCSTPNQSVANMFFPSLARNSNLYSDMSQSIMFLNGAWLDDFLSKRFLRDEIWGRLWRAYEKVATPGYQFEDNLVCPNESITNYINSVNAFYARLGMPNNSSYSEYGQSSRVVML